jgi:DNA-binding NarL/FixJ family response regulator
VVVRVVVGEDSLLVREGIATLLARRKDIEVVELCEDLPTLTEAIEQQRPDVVVTDIRMPPTGGDEGIQVANRLSEESPNTGVVVLSQYAEPGYALDLFRAGSEGRAYLLKERLSDPEQLARAILEVADGGSVVDPRIVESLVRGPADRDGGVVDRLSPREREVLEQIAEGKNNAAVAEALVLSERAVEKHISSLFSKLGLAKDDSTHRRVKAVLLYLGDQGS